MQRTIFPILFLVLFSGSAIAQNNIEDQLPQKPTYKAEEVIDATYGITLYEPLNKSLKGDSTRNCAGYACSGWVEDHYTDGSLLHKGYYDGGQLLIYSNFFPNGNTEREFKIKDTYVCQMKLYYETGTLKSQIRYRNQEPIQWTDYYENGNMEYNEEYDKNFEFYQEKVYYYEDGKEQSAMRLENKKSMLYSYKEYHPNGTVSLEGYMQYTDDALDYQRVDKWSSYDESGTLKKEEFYVFGKVNEEKNY